MPKAAGNKYRPQHYRIEWEKEKWAQGWLSASKQSQGKAYCSFCDKHLAPGKSELIGHSKSSLHTQRAKTSLQNRSVTSFLTSARNATAAKAELNVVALIARKNISFNFLDSLVATLHGIGDDSKAIKNMTCNRTKGTYLLTECLARYAHEQLVDHLKSSSGFSILCDKATDITMNKVFCVNVRYLECNQPVTLFYRLIPVEDGDANGLFTSLENALKSDAISWEKVVGYASDGENLMQGGNDSVLTRMKEAAPNLFVLKCYCHTFHLVAEHASKELSKTADQLIHDVYNYFKLSPNRQKSFAEFQMFVDVEAHKILKPCQTRWLSVAQCVRRILEQWPALELFMIAEASERNVTRPQVDRILNALRAPYVKATMEFCDFVLGDLTGLNLIFQSNEFQLHRLVTEVERTVRMFCQNFRRPIERLADINVDDESLWLPIDKVYPGILASETISKLLPHERESFLGRCRGWYREAVRQITSRVNLSDPVLNALRDVHHTRLLNGSADMKSGGVLAIGLPRMTTAPIQTLDRQWRSLFVDDQVKRGHWEERSIMEFWQGMSQLPEYCEIGTFMLRVTSLPQSTAEVERTFSKVNNNKTKLRNSLSVTTLEAILKSAETFTSSTFEVNSRLLDLHAGARKAYMDRYSAKEQKEAESAPEFI